MTAQIAAYGRLVADPQLKTTSKGTQMTMASMAVPLPCSQADDGTAMMWLRQRDTWKTQETEHKANRTGRTKRTTAKRLTDRDREVMECFRNRW